jgi:hypothetical protein
MLCSLLGEPQKEDSTSIHISLYNRDAWPVKAPGQDRYLLASMLGDRVAKAVL